MLRSTISLYCYWWDRRIYRYYILSQPQSLCISHLLLFHFPFLPPIQCASVFHGKNISCLMKVRFFDAKHFYINLRPTLQAHNMGRRHSYWPWSGPRMIPGTYVHLILKTVFGAEDLTLILDRRSLPSRQGMREAQPGPGPQWTYLWAVKSSITGWGLHFFFSLNSFFTNLPLVYICAIFFHYYLNCDLGKAEFC